MQFLLHVLCECSQNDRDVPLVLIHGFGADETVFDELIVNIPNQNCRFLSQRNQRPVCSNLQNTVQCIIQYNAQFIRSQYQYYVSKLTSMTKYQNSGRQLNLIQKYELLLLARKLQELYLNDLDNKGAVQFDEAEQEQFMGQNSKTINLRQFMTLDLMKELYCRTTIIICILEEYSNINGFALSTNVEQLQILNLYYDLRYLCYKLILIVGVQTQNSHLQRKSQYYKNVY
ncbi:Hypothetical_protein [Hexamita inflata]|uniref:Hypothetical_protein n=1 Tax=Hexamita inflata TaxID=28002 RepID=A0AA86R7Y8_9EUKA|nr:Hypothetical protein HINF_LOCUS58812 [Hexamita inflata]